ncbi:gephyrin-like molybdotransferase Glp [Cohnella hongkongensis]|uniref:Molybdopterin molybdenumtransferase n=1 Tax=Cohnella hongkongensis TaxID=178337 RepID=A0ABV9F6B2_9BACL
MQHTDSPERFRRQAKQPEEAQRAVLDHARFLGAENVSLYEAWGRHLAEELIAPHPFPAFRRSGMDGYAVRSADLKQARPESPAELEVLESLPGGAEPKHPIGPGQASRIMTGGMVPEGADAVVMLEMTSAGERDGMPIVRIGKSVPSGVNLSEIGSEIRLGDRLLPVGQPIGPGESALLASCGYTRVAAARRPRVAILSTGSELLEVDEPLAPAKIRNSNAPMLAALVREFGGEPLMLGKVPDRAEEAEERVRQALSGCDLLLTSGGVSVGDYDVMADIVARPDAKLLFNKVAMRPGSPTSAALFGEKLILALSGNPGACFVGFHLFAVPALRRMLGVERPLHPAYSAFLGEDFPKVNAYRRYVRAATEIRDGQVWVTPTGDDKSSLMTTIVGSDCLIEIPPTKEGLKRGQPVKAWKIRP